MRRAARVNTNPGEIVEALLSVTDVSVHSLAGVGCGCPDLLIGARGLSWARRIAAAAHDTFVGRWFCVYANH